MLFNSLQFLVFFPVVTILFFVLPHKYRWFLLLSASCVFYMAFIPVYILILAITIIIDYFAGIYIERTEGKKRKTFLIISILSTCFVLFVFKYFNFFNTNFAAIAKLFHWNYPIEALKIILPIGLSFHTFQSLSYVIEVYRGNQKAEKHFGIYALYVMFYPQLVAGPIERPQNLLHQFREVHTFDYQRVTDGLKLIAWGLFKKIVIADRLSIFVNAVYDNPHDYTGIPLITATVFFAFQIYCDFSGYSDIAIGSAQVMGFKLMDNFNRPYFSKSISEFWKRWHISLSTWFKDYLYITLGGNRCRKSRVYFNYFVTFTVSGLWHGANWTYVIWGSLNGAYLIFALITRNIRNTIRSAFLAAFARIKKPLFIAAVSAIAVFAVFFNVNNKITAANELSRAGISSILTEPSGTSNRAGAPSVSPRQINPAATVNQENKNHTQTAAEIILIETAKVLSAFLIIALAFFVLRKINAAWDIVPPFSYRYVQVLITFTLTCFAWIFFRAKNFSDAMYIVTHIPVLNLKDFQTGQLLSGYPKSEFYIAIISLFVMEFIHLVQRHGKIRHMLAERPAWQRWSFYYFIVISTILFGYFNTDAQFIYFQF